MTEPEAQDGGLERATREFTYRQTSRFIFAVTDPAAVAAAAGVRPSRVLDGALDGVEPSPRQPLG